MNGKQLKNSILQWAIQGRLVPQNPADEPACVLLERIRQEKTRIVKEGKIKRDKNETIIYRGADNSHYEKFADGTVRCIDNEIPFEIPENWAWVRVGTVFNHSSGKQQSSNNRKIGTICKYITTSNLYWGKFSLENVKEMYFTDEEIITCSATKGDLLVCEGGAGYGRSAIWDKDYDICLQNHVHRLRPYANGIAEYTYYLIYLLKESNQLDSIGTAMPGLSANRLKSILIPLPPLVEQQRIVAKLEEVMPAVERYDKAQAELDSLNDSIKDLLKKSILQDAIQGRLVSQIDGEEPVSELLKRIAKEKQDLLKQGKLKAKDITDSTIFRGADNRYYEKVGKSTRDITDYIPFQIPESWQWIRLGSVIVLLSGRDLEPTQYNSFNNGIPYITGASNFAKEGLIVNRWTMEPVTVSKKGDLLITCKGTIGTMLFNNIGDVHIARQVMAIRTILCNMSYIMFFLEWYLSSLQKKAKSIIPGISRDDLLKAFIPLPPFEEQKRIEEKMSLIRHSLEMA